MIGAASVGAYYHGFEPSTRTHAGLMRLGEFLKEFNTGFDYKIECLPFEDSDISDDYDVALTSPPYYDTEHYSEEPTQARNRYATFAAFADGFLLPMVEKATKATKNGLIVNIGSRQYPIRKTIESRYSAIDLNVFRLSGRKGLGKENAEGEVFLHIINAINMQSGTSTDLHANQK